MDCSAFLFAHPVHHKTSKGEGEGREVKHLRKESEGQETSEIKGEVKHFEKKWEREEKTEDKNEENKKGIHAYAL